TATDIQDKVQDYLAAGTKLIWLVFPLHKIVTVYRSLDIARHYNYEDSLDGGDVIPGFRYALSRLFRER
ncbi:MAG: Uma2 family endonuclease, partial [Chloroflexota bacterium]|nr:Uma2 family endonuclease [Chloroflexota bacterium]